METSTGPEAEPDARPAPTPTIDEAHHGPSRRPSISKRPSIRDMDDDGTGVPSAFERLPDEIIQQILFVVDAGTFASLVLLNRKWRRVSQQAHLYAHHLSQCPSYAASHGTAAPPATASDRGDDDGRLPRLRRQFAREVKRNLFAAYMRPRETAIKLVSNSISSSTCPGGEGMQFSPSPRGHHLLAYNSSRIYVVDVRAAEGVAVKRELGILRRPLSACIKDDATLLAVLSTDMQVDVYDLKRSPPRRTHSLVLDHTPRTIAMSPCGSVLAAAYEGGIEVSSLSPGALATDRRAVKCDGVDALAFSFDGTQLLGTTTHSATSPNTVILTAPYYDPGMDSQMSEDNISALWTTSILFPNTTRDCSHAVLLQNTSHEEATWTFTYDRSFETFRAVRIDDLRNGTTYFTGPLPSPSSQARLLPSTLPAANYYGDLVSAGFQGKEIWLYGVPEDLDAIQDQAVSAAASDSSSNQGLNRRNSGPSQRTPHRGPEGQASRVPQWQILCDKQRNTFVWGSKVAELDGVSCVKWVAGFGDSCLKERLVIAARGVMPPKPVTDEDGIDFVDGGRITLLDFDYGLENGTKVEVTIEVGTSNPEVLEEEQRDMAEEVAIVRRRTVAQRGGHRGAISRATTSAARPPPLLRTRLPDNDSTDPLVPRRIAVLREEESEVPSAAAEDSETASIDEQEALDAPYSHASPRSVSTLRRAATAAAMSRRLHPEAAAAGHITYRRADGRTEHPHESDADNWVPPPPPYQEEDPQDLPAFLRHGANAKTVGPTPPGAVVAGTTASDGGPSVPAHPPPMAAHPPPMAAHPPLMSAHPPPMSAHPPPMSPHPPPISTHPPPISTHPHAMSAHPHPMSAYQPPVSARPSTSVHPPMPAYPPPVPPIPPVPQIPTLHLPQRPMASPPAQLEQQRAYPTTSAAPALQPPALSAAHERAVSGATVVSRASEDDRQGGSSPIDDLDGENIYDVSPPDTPRLGPNGSDRPVSILSAMPASTQSGGDAQPTNQQPPNALSTGASTMPVAEQAPLSVGPTMPPAQQPPSSAASTMPLTQHQPLSATSTMPATHAAPPSVASDMSSASRTAQPPTLDIQIPSPSMGSATWHLPDGSGAAYGNAPPPPGSLRLPSSQTWPRVQAQPPEAAYTAGPLPSGFPHSAPAGVSINERLMAALPPAPQPDRYASLGGRQDGVAPHRLSGGPGPGGFHVSRVPVGSGGGTVQGDTQTQISNATTLFQPSYPHPQQFQNSPNISSSPSTSADRPRRDPPPEPDQPLIISTPAGVQGAFDEPTRRASHRGRGHETPLVAPVPRRAGTAPAPGTPVPPGQRPGGTLHLPTVERFESIFSAAEQQEDASAEAAAAAGRAGNGNSNGGVSRNGSGHRRGLFLGRRKSRAERSAARNMAAARKNGFVPASRSKSSASNKKKQPSSSKLGRRNKHHLLDADTMSTAAWTDISGASAAGGATINSGPPGGSGVLLGLEAIAAKEREAAARRDRKRDKDKDGKCTVM